MLEIFQNLKPMYVVLIILVLVLIAVYAKEKNSKKPDTPQNEKLPYKLRDSVLTKAELNFSKALGQYVSGSYIILTKVRLYDIFYVYGSSNRSSYNNKISQKHVDFLICDRITFAPVYAIELDDSSHNRPSVQDRDEEVNAIYASAGLKLIHIKCRGEYTEKDFKEVIDYQNLLIQMQEL